MSIIGAAALQRASHFLGSTTYQRAPELGMPPAFANNPVNQGGLCASFVSSVLSQVGFPALSLSYNLMHAHPDVLRTSLLAAGFTPVPFAGAPPGSVVLWPNNEHAAFLVHSDGVTATTLSSNNDYRPVPQTVRIDGHFVANEQRALVLRPPI